MIEALCVVAGVALGLVFYGGLWLSVRNGIDALTLSAGFFVRMAVVLGGFYFVCGHDWPRYVACLIGFFAAKVVVTRSVMGRRVHRCSPARASGGSMDAGGGES